MPTDLETLHLLDPPSFQALDWFIGTCLYDGGIWDSPRTSDGIQSIGRVLERGPDRLRVGGRIYEIDQTLHTFRLELSRAAADDRVTWSLDFDVTDDSACRATLLGEAVIEDGALAIVPGTTRVIARD
jgi:hypothetical protein